MYCVVASERVSFRRTIISVHTTTSSPNIGLHLTFHFTKDIGLILHWVSTHNHHLILHFTKDRGLILHWVRGQPPLSNSLFGLGINISHPLTCNGFCYATLLPKYLASQIKESPTCICTRSTISYAVW